MTKNDTLNINTSSLVYRGDGGIFGKKPKQPQAQTPSSQGGSGGESGGGGDSEGGSASSPQDIEDTLRSRAVVNALFLIGEGEIEGPPSDDILKDLYFDETPVKSPSGKLNFSRFKVDYRRGTQGQPRLRKIAQKTLDSEQSVDVEVKKSLGPVVRTINQLEADSARVRVYSPRLLAQNDEGKYIGIKLQFKVEVSANGGAYQEVQGSPFTISGIATSGYQKSYEFDLSGVGPWDIKMTRLSDDSDSLNQYDLVFQALTAIEEAKLTYPNSALLHIQIDAEQFSQVPNVALRLKLLKVKVPVNYNPVSREYTGEWDGTFKVAWTDNPAWILYDLMLNKRYGAGTRLTSSYVDKWSFYKVARYCDELVPDGRGGREPRFTCNCYIQDRTNAYDLFNSLSSVFRGMVYWCGGQVVLGQDAPTTATRLFSAENVIVEEDDSGERTSSPFSYAGSALKARHTAAYVTWIDSDDFNRSKVEYVEDRVGIEKLGYRPIEITAFGCTSQGQAHRVGLWTLASERLQTDTVTFKTTNIASDLLPGEIIKIADSLKSGVRKSGRIVSSTSTAITLDAPQTLDPGKTYTLSVLKPDGKLESRAVSTDAGTHSILTVSSPYTASHVGIYVLEDPTVLTQLYRVISVSEEEDQHYAVTAIVHNPSIYDYVDKGVKLQERDTSRFPNPFNINPPAHINIEEHKYLNRSRTDVKYRVEVSWSKVPNASLYHVDYSFDDSGWKKLRTTPDLHTTVEDADVGTYKFRIKSENRFGYKSGYAYNSIETVGLTSLPPDVQDFSFTAIESAAILDWDPVNTVDVRVGGKFIIKHSPRMTGAIWESASTITTKSGTSTQTTVPLKNGTYLIKAVDSEGNESENASTIVADVAGFLEFNLIESLPQDPTFPGAKDNTIVDNGELLLTNYAFFDLQSGTFDDATGTFDDYALDQAGVLPRGYYYFSPIAKDLGSVLTSRVTATLRYSGVDNFSEWDYSKGKVDDKGGLVDGGKSGKANARLEISTSKNGVDYTPWSKFLVGDYTTRYMKFRVRMESFSPETNVSVEELKVTIDVPDRVEKGSLVTSTAGTTKTFNYAFREVPKLGISMEDANTGDYFRITAKSPNSFTIRCFNSAGTGISRTVDWIATGFGKILN